MGKVGKVLLEKEIGRMKWSEKADLVFRFCRYQNQKGIARDGIDIRVHVMGKTWQGWSKVGMWVYADSAEEFSRLFNLTMEELRKNSQSRDGPKI